MYTVKSLFGVFTDHPQYGDIGDVKCNSAYSQNNLVLIRGCNIYNAEGYLNLLITHTISYQSNMRLHNPSIGDLFRSGNNPQ